MSARRGRRRHQSSGSDAEESSSMAETTDIGSEMTAEGDPKDTFKILVASDIHLGYCDSDVLRADDSFNTFEEILQIALEKDVDFVLLGGDLFHENKPKAATLQRAIDILRKYCLSSREVRFNHVSDPKVDFRHLENPVVNFKNENINVGLPVFSIHGNHDDPVGSRKISAIDHLASAGLLNHFGMYDSLNEIDVKPVLLEKGSTRLALYGLGCMKDERLFRLFRDKKVRFHREADVTDSWFNIFVLHQNRVKHGPKNYIPPIFFPSFLHLVIWGHEHECKIELEAEGTGHLDKDSGDYQCYISQPGSSVATSLALGEQVQKKVGLFSIHGKKFKIEPIKLKTVRPFVMEDLYTSVMLESIRPGQNVEEFLENYVAAKVEQLIGLSTDQLTEHSKQPVEPLIRVRVGYLHECEMFNSVRFAQRFAGKVANEDIVMFKKCPKKGVKLGSMDVGDLEEMIMMDEEVHDLEGHVEEIVEAFFTIGRQNDERDKILEILSEKKLSDAVKALVEKNDKEAIADFVDIQINATIQHLLKKGVDADTIDDELERFRDARNASQDEDVEEARKALKHIEGLQQKKRTANVSHRGDGDHGNGVESILDSDEDQNNEITLSSDEERAPTRGRGRGSRGPRGGRARGSTSSTSARGSRGSTRAKPRGRSGF